MPKLVHSGMLPAINLSQVGTTMYTFAANTLWNVCVMQFIG
ncbi:hypothetical protein [Pseudomonas graminis]|nr:hypothetical protein [Pseudomonas graminis]